jgi:catechol 2,3-dioxygenase-like lactoylglutathione lyase family enzyme
MENVISSILDRYERGALSRRELIQGMAMLLATGVTASASDSKTAANSAVQVSRIHHVSIQVRDVQRSVKFYQDAFGLPIFNEDKKTEPVRLTAGSGRLVIRHADPPGVVDHFALGVDHLDKAKVTQEMKQHGITPTDTGEPLTFHVVDPDGYPVQMISTSS